MASDCSSGGDPDLRRNRMLLWLLVLGTIPAGIAGLALQKQADTTLRTLPIIGASAILIGLFMWWADRAGRGQKDLGHVSLADSLADRFRAGPGHHSRRFAQRHHHLRRIAPQSGPAGRRALLLSPLHADHPGRRRQRRLGSAQA